jgi:hypothetical protein
MSHGVGELILASCDDVDVVGSKADLEPTFLGLWGRLLDEPLKRIRADSVKLGNEPFALLVPFHRNCGASEVVLQDLANLFTRGPGYVVKPNEAIESHSLYNTEPTWCRRRNASKKADL